MRTSSTTSLNIFQLIPPSSNTSPNLFDNRQALPPQEIYPPMVSSVKAAAAGKVAAVKKEEVSPPKGDGQLSVMLAMGIAIIFITLRLADYLYEAPGVGETIFSSFIICPQRCPGRLGKQCRERWLNHLDPAINRGNWVRVTVGVGVGVRNDTIDS